MNQLNSVSFTSMLRVQTFTKPQKRFCNATNVYIMPLVCKDDVINIFFFKFLFQADMSLLTVS